MQPWYLIFIFVGFAAAVQAGKTYTEKTCLTAMCTKSVKHVPTHSAFSKKTYKVFSTAHVQTKVTVTPRPATRTVTRTVVTTVDTTADVRTDTVQVVATDVETSTITSSTTYYDTTTSTVTTSVASTTTVPVDASFVAAQDSMEDGTMSGSSGASKRNDVESDSSGPMERESYHAGAGSLLPRRAGRSGVADYKKMYPKEVNCVVTTLIPQTIVITKSKSAKTITARASTKTITSTATVTDTSTVFPSDASVETTSITTLIVETTVFPSTTLTTTSTTTNTVNLVASTIYAACGSNNYVDSKNNVGQFAGPSRPSGIDESDVSASSAYDCCVQCFSAPDCVGGIFVSSVNICAMMVRSASSYCPDESPCSVIVPYYSGSSPSYVFLNGGGLQWKD